MPQLHGNSEHSKDERTPGYLGQSIEEAGGAHGLLRGEPGRERHPNYPLLVGRRVDNLDDRFKCVRHTASQRAR